MDRALSKLIERKILRRQHVPKCLGNAELVEGEFMIYPKNCCLRNSRASGGSFVGENLPGGSAAGHRGGGLVAVAQRQG